VCPTTWRGRASSSPLPNPLALLDGLHRLPRELRGYGLRINFEVEGLLGRTQLSLDSPRTASPWPASPRPVSPRGAFGNMAAAVGAAILGWDTFLFDTGSIVHLVGPQGYHFFTGEIYEADSIVLMANRSSATSRCQPSSGMPTLARRLLLTSCVPDNMEREGFFEPPTKPPRAVGWTPPSPPRAPRLWPPDQFRGRRALGQNTAVLRLA
jgi:hypothetical protein